MIRGLRNIERRVLPQGWADAARQLLLFAAAYYAYQIVRGAVDGKVAVAAWNATKIINLEHSLHVFAEPSVQAWASSRGWIIHVADWMYLNCHFVVTFGALVFIYLRRNDSFYFVRNMFMIAMGFALVGYAALPDRAAAADAGVGLHRLGRRLHRRARRERARQRAAEPVRGGPVDARLLRADGRLAARAAREAAAAEGRSGSCIRSSSRSSSSRPATTTSSTPSSAR